MCQDCGCNENDGHEHTHTHEHKDGHEHTHKHKNGEHEHTHTHEKQVKKDKPSTVILNKSVKETNDKIATEILNKLRGKKVFSINLLGSPGSGKTTIIENLAEQISPESILVIQGDLESDIDKVRLEKKGIKCYQINTHSGCHLNAQMIEQIVNVADFTGIKYLIIENVGNLVCPAGIKIGQHMDMVVSSVVEGNDKPMKYPYIFMGASIIVVTKYDLAEHVNFNEQEYFMALSKINKHAKVIKSSMHNPECFVDLKLVIETAYKHEYNEKNDKPFVYDTKNKCPECGAILYHSDTVCKECLNEVEPKYY
jgi:hydrogenase nickel incorporation protein HypB